MTHRNSRRNASGWAAGLIAHDQGVMGVTFEQTDSFTDACGRFDRVAAALNQSRLDGEDDNRHGWFALHLIAESQLLSIESLKWALSDSAICYASGGFVWVEWVDAGGWRDRRALSPKAVNLLEGGSIPHATPSDWRWIRAWLRECCTEYDEGDSLACFMLDALAWWFVHLSPAHLAHCCGLRRRNLMPPEFLARRESGLPQAIGRSRPDRDLDDLSEHLAPRARSGGEAKVRSLIQYAGNIARDKESKDSGRAKILDRIQALLPLAALESRNCVLILAASRHALVAGGAHGKKWAPVTFYEYLRITVDPLLGRLDNISLDELDGAAFHAVYQTVLDQLPATQRDKCSAFLQVFHRFLMIVGADPLPAPLSGGVQLAHYAADFTPGEIRIALEYIDHHADTEKLRLQARLIVLLGYELPLRSYEYWCLRIQDIDPLAGAWVVIYPRRSDGQGKVAGLRRTENVQSIEVRGVLLDLLRLRRYIESAADDDLLLGEALSARVRHEVAATERLVSAALRWASGDEAASIYDLRHACFQRLARARGV